MGVKFQFWRSLKPFYTRLENVCTGGKSQNRPNSSRPVIILANVKGFLCDCNSSECSIGGSDSEMAQER